MAVRQVRALLMGGQACVFYGAAEFSRDTDLLILADQRNVELLKFAVGTLVVDRSGFTFHVSRFTHHASRITHH